jgi:hypothetical protein
MLSQIVTPLVRYGRIMQHSIATGINKHVI